MDFLLDTRFVVGLVAGALFYYLWCKKMGARGKGM